MQNPSADGASPELPKAPKVAVLPAPPPTLIPARVILGAGDAGAQLLLPTDWDEQIKPTGPSANAAGKSSSASPTPTPTPLSATGTDGVTWSAAPAGIVAVSSTGYVTPLSAGTATITARRPDQADAVAQSTAEVLADRFVASRDRTWDYVQDIQPLLTRAGCNTGGCHARLDGQNGFHLSLYGYDAEGDYRAITHQDGGRRVNAIQPDASLLLEKATGRMAHGGGRRITPDSYAYRQILEWISAGAPYQRGRGHGVLTRVEVVPPAIKRARLGTARVRVVAKFADGHERDVTRLASYRTNDDAVADIDDQGLITLKNRGETDVIVRYGSRVLPVRTATPYNEHLKFDFASARRANVVDEKILKRLEELRVPPSPPADDAGFLRRLSLDLTGETPTPALVREYVRDQSPDKKAKMVERLLKERDFERFWVLKLGDLLMITQNRFQNGAGYYEVWLRRQMAANTPWNVMVRELLVTLGNPNSEQHAAANYALEAPDAETKAELSAQRFLGIRMRCAKCHDHPFDVWTQDDYFGFAAFFAKAGVSAPDPNAGMTGRPEVRLNPSAVVTHLRTKNPAIPRLLDGSTAEITPDGDPRIALADWMTRPDNPYFAKAAVNWVWAQFFGRGLAEPADDLSAANPPVHPEVLDALAKEFVKSKYDLRALIRLIALSETYGASARSVPENAMDRRLFSHHLPRPLTAHQMADALASATNIPNRYRDRSPGTKAIEIFDPANASEILDTFGRCNRINGCSPVANPPLSLRQTLLLIGGDTVDNKVSALNGYLAGLIELEMPAADIVENLYLRALCRFPAAEERDYWVKELNAVAKSESALREITEDLFWSLLNSREFAFNH